MTINSSTALKTAKLTATLGQIDAKSGNAKMQFYTGAKPASVGAVSYQVKLFEFTMSKPAGTVSAGQLLLSFTGRASVIADGRIGWARIVDGDGVALMDLDAGLAGSGADVIMATLDVNTGSSVESTTAYITES